MLKIFCKILYKLRKCGRRFSRKIRAWYYAQLFKSCGTPLPRIGDHVKISYPSMISFGDGGALNPYTYLDGKGGIEFGDNVMVSYGVKIVTGSLEIDPNGKISHRHIRKKVVIGNNVWIGTDAVILPGVTIGDNTIVGAASVVTKDLEGGHIYVGTPPRIVRDIVTSGGKADASKA